MGAEAFEYKKLICSEEELKAAARAYERAKQSRQPSSIVLYVKLSEFVKFEINPQSGEINIFCQSSPLPYDEVQGTVDQIAKDFGLKNYTESYPHHDSSVLLKQFPPEFELDHQPFVYPKYVKNTQELSYALSICDAAFKVNNKKFQKAVSLEISFDD